MQPLVSILMNCYNGEKFIQEALESVYAQTYNNWEVILVDNNSDDRSMKIAKTFDERVKLLATPSHMNLGEARNFGMRFCGDLMAVLDVDDFWEPEALELLVQGLRLGDFAMCYGNQITVDEMGKEMSRKRSHFSGMSGNFLPNILKQMDIPQVATIFDLKKIRERNIEFDTNIIGSVEFSFFLPIACNFKINSIDDFVVNYRIHESLSSKLDDIRFIERRKILKNNLDLYPEKFSGLSRELRLSLARADYYEAQYRIVKNERLKGSALLLKNSLLDYRYFILFLASLNIWIWGMLQKLKYKRKLL